MGLSVGRICVGSSDYSTKLYSYDDGEADPELTKWHRRIHENRIR